MRKIYKVSNSKNCTHNFRIDRTVGLYSSLFGGKKEKATHDERPKHLKVTAYGCWISPLTKFTGSHHRGPSSRAAQKHQERKADCNVNRPLRQRGENSQFSPRRNE